MREQAEQSCATHTGTVTEAMLSKVTSQEKARKFAEHAESAGAMIGESE